MRIPIPVITMRLRKNLMRPVARQSHSYNPNANSYSSYNYATASQLASSSSSSSSSTGTSYSFGALAGMRLTKKLVIQSGVQYMNQSIGSESNINAPVSLDAVANFAKSSQSYNTTS